MWSPRSKTEKKIIVALQTSKRQQKCRRAKEMIKQPSKVATSIVWTEGANRCLNLLSTFFHLSSILTRKFLRSYAYSSSQSIMGVTLLVPQPYIPQPHKHYWYIYLGISFQHRSYIIYYISKLFKLIFINQSIYTKELIRLQFSRIMKQKWP